MLQWYVLCACGILHILVALNLYQHVVAPVAEEEQLPMEVGFDICGTDPEPEISIDQGKPRMHLNLPCVLKSFTSLMLMLCCIRGHELSDNLITALPSLILQYYPCYCFI
jgi:hypothetical protein